jgi:hypothetical protein
MYKVDVGFLGGGRRFMWLGIADVSESGDALFYGARRYGVYNLNKGQVVSAGRKILSSSNRDGGGGRKIEPPFSGAIPNISGLYFCFANIYFGQCRISS